MMAICLIVDVVDIATTTINVTVTTLNTTNNTAATTTLHDKILYFSFFYFIIFSLNFNWNEMFLRRVSSHHQTDNLCSELIR